MYALENDLVAGTPPAHLKRVLDEVSPIYRERLWPIHDALNRKSIEKWQTAMARSQRRPGIAMQRVKRG
ncbi:MAG TPA: hypothetical protein VKT72_14115 [Candidatus Baltobacteraceae bacterium]|nr:hypothetical protein [Candidatus Baltobacteraceae bacterium]